MFNVIYYYNLWFLREKYFFNLNECLVIIVWLYGYFFIGIYLEKIDFRVRIGFDRVIRVLCIDIYMKFLNFFFGGKCGVGDIVFIVYCILLNIYN